jgi:diadenosine tetraphosphate (Ap4A) HIT family hydrolase
MWALVDVVKARLDATYRPDGYNVGFNAGQPRARPWTTCTST